MADKCKRSSCVPSLSVLCVKQIVAFTCFLRQTKADRRSANAALGNCVYLYWLSARLCMWTVEARIVRVFSCKMPSTVGPRRRVLVLLLAILVFTGTMYLVAAENESENDGVCSAGDTREECLEIFASANSESAEDVKNSWALASLAESNMGLTDVTLSGVYQSPIDLCDDLEFDEDCVEYVSEVKSQPFRCIVSIGEVLHSYEQPMNPTMASTIMKHLQWKQIIVIAVAIAFLTYFGIGTCREGWDDVLLNNFLYLFGMGLSIYLTTPAIHFFSWRSPIDIVRESFTAFQIVHPMESTAIVLSHFATYWLNIAAWFPGSVRSMLVWTLRVSASSE